MIKKKKKTLSKLGLEENFLNLTKTSTKKSVANITLNGEKLDSFSPNIRNKARISSLIPFTQHHTSSPSC